MRVNASQKETGRGLVQDRDTHRFAANLAGARSVVVLAPDGVVPGRDPRDRVPGARRAEHGGGVSTRGAIGEDAALGLRGLEAGRPRVARAVVARCEEKGRGRQTGRQRETDEGGRGKNAFCVSSNVGNSTDMDKKICLDLSIRRVVLTFAEPGARVVDEPEGPAEGARGAVEPLPAAAPVARRADELRGHGHVERVVELQLVLVRPRVRREEARRDRRRLARSLGTARNGRGGREGGRRRRD